MGTVKSSAETMEAVCNAGLAKSKMTLSTNLILAFFAGAYIGFGSILAIKCAGGMPLETWGSLQRLIFGGVFPIGLMMVVLAGADLFTGDCMYMPSGVWKHGVGLDKFVRVLVLAYIGNFIGSVFLAKLSAYTGLLADPASAKYAVSVANSKVVLPFGVAFVRGIFCNWLVCLALYMAVAGGSGVSKLVMMWVPIFAFVALGFEHSIANMTFIPLGIFIGSAENYAGGLELTATWGGLIKNLIPVTLGNFLGGSVFVAWLYYKANGIKKA
jgi:formate/nitrite transporter